MFHPFLGPFSHLFRRRFHLNGLILFFDWPEPFLPEGCELEVLVVGVSILLTLRVVVELFTTDQDPINS